jgi:hypothetical protein
MKPIVVALALMLLPTPAAAEPFAGKLSDLPPIVQEHVRNLEGECSALQGKPVYRLSEVVHVHALSGPTTRDYIIDGKKFGCRGASPGCPGSMGCVLAVYVKRHGEWSAVEGELAIGWYTIPRPGKRTVMVIKRRCYGTKDAPCYERYCYSSALRVTRDGMKEVALRRQKREGCD